MSKGDRQTDLHVNLFTFYSRKFLLDLHIFLDFYRNWRLVVQAHSQCQWQCRRYPILPELRVSVSVSVSAKLREIVRERERDGGIERYGVKAAAVARNDAAYFARFSTIFCAIFCVIAYRLYCSKLTIDSCKAHVKCR